MNSAIVAVVGIGWLLGAYWLYGRFIEKKLIQPDDTRKTPAHRLLDGVDFFPASRLVLFGHHFSSIAGAGPIIGPVIAVAAFGYGVSLLWILIGVVFIGAVHDYTTAMLSVRHNGDSVPSIAGDMLGRRTRALFLLFVWITLIFIVAVFLIAAKNTFLSDPRVVIPAFGLIPLAMVFGWAVNRRQVPLVPATVVSILCMGGLFALGIRLPIAIHAIDPGALEKLGAVSPVQLATVSASTASHIWLGVLTLYGLAAAVLPVWLLLQPRDYIGYWILAFGMVAGFAGLIITQKPITLPFFSGTTSSSGPIWPMLFILVACGAVSGFHSLVSSGTTSKQLDKESHGRPVVFGAMITEGALALLALLAVSAGLSTVGEGGVPGNVLPSFMDGAQANPIGAFAAGFGAFTDPFLGTFGALFGVVMINAFVLTTLDTSVRLGRFITTELAGSLIRPLQNRWVATLLVGLLAYALAASGNVWTLWKMFGASNQLVAALAMIVVSVDLVQNRLPARYTVLPAAFMLVTTFGALVWQGHSFLTGDDPNYVLALAAGLLLLLAVFVGFQGVRVIRQKARP